MSQVVQAKCPHCGNVLRIPADWLNQEMRCKHCKKMVQAKTHASTSANVATSAAATALKTGLPIGKPAKAPPADASSQPFAIDQGEPASTPTRRRRSNGGGCVVLVLMMSFLLLAGVGTAGFVVYKAINLEPNRNPKQIANSDSGKKTVSVPSKDGVNADGPTDQPSGKKDKQGGTPTADGKPASETDKKKPGGKKPAGPELFPRRALLISVNNYLMFNTVHHGSPEGAFSSTYPGSSTGALRRRLSLPPMNFPATQVFELSDGIPPEAGKAHSTQKSVLETTIKEFLEASRAQDRVFLLYAGHATYIEDDKEKAAYLIPIDGNLKKPESLLPLKWVLDQLAACKAQQKILVLDVFRYSPSRGFEYPSAGEGDDGVMPEGFDKAIENPPAGVQVWCSCVKEQNSIELEGGSAFLQALCNSMQGGGELTGISNPSQPIQIEQLVVKVNKRLDELAKIEKRTQTSRLMGKGPDAMVAYDRSEPMPAKLELKPPSAAGAKAASYASVNSILDEIKEMPPVRDTRAGDRNLLTAANLPAFNAEKIASYKPEGYKDVKDLHQKHKTGGEAFAKEFPLRAAYFDALDALQKSSRIQMMEVLSSPVDPKLKASFLQKQAPAGMSIFELEGVLKNMKEVAEERDKETSKRWQANFDYAQARLQARLVYLFEYNYTVGQIRADALPDLGKGQTGWRIGTGKKVAVTEAKAKGYAKDAKKLWQRIQDEYPDTPWALLAQRESLVSLGLEWRPKSD